MGKLLTNCHTVVDICPLCTEILRAREKLKTLCHIHQDSQVAIQKALQIRRCQWENNIPLPVSFSVDIQCWKLRLMIWEEKK